MVARLLEAKATSGHHGTGLVHQWIEAQAARTPEAIAVTSPTESISYRKLNGRANRLAHQLQPLGVCPESLVALCTSRSVSMVVGLLAVLKAGGAYVPLDPAYPSERLAFMLEDSGSTIVLTERNLRGKLPGGEAHVLTLDSEPGDLDIEDDRKPAAATIRDNLAYVIYTSGSTGKPKGVQVTHGSLANLLQSMRALLGISARDAMLAVTTLSFDIAALEILLPLIVGARVDLVAREIAADGERLIRRVNGPGITFLQATPATWRLLIDAGWRGKPGLVILCGGEALPRALADRLLDKGEVLWNLYGPTETTIWSSAWRVEGGELPICVGRPISGTRLYVLDKWLRPVPVGVTGELYIGGVGLARGYWKRPGLTADRFIPDPFDSGGGRLYRTSDLARWLPDGTLECLGRLDHQVKIRGFRVELGEIEAVLSEHPAVSQAVVAARPDTSGDLGLFAYVVLRESHDADLDADLRSWISGRLPEYMVPASFLAVGALPLTPNGKIDRKALPEPGRRRMAEDALDLPPRGPIEEALAGICAELLGVDRVGVHDNFFELGGHSLLASQFLARVRHTFDVEVPLKDFIDEASVARLAWLVEDALSNGRDARIPPLERAQRNGPLPASFAQQRLWFLDQLEPGQVSYNIPAAVRLMGRLDVPALERAFREIVHRHEVLRTRFESREGVPHQVIAPSLEVHLEVEDLRDLPEQDRQIEAMRRVTTEARRPFDLAQGPLIRMALVRLGEEEHIVLVTMHHIVSDGWSIGILIREVSALYEAYRKGESSPLEEPPVQYADYAVWQRGWLEGEVLQAQIDYWTSRLAGLSPLELLTDRPRSAGQARGGAVRTAVLPRAVLEKARGLSQNNAATLYMTLLAVFQVLLYRYSGQDNFGVGSPIAGRMRSELEGLIGFFVNTLVMRAELAGNPSFRDLLSRVRQSALDAYTHQDLPFEKLVGVLHPKREASRTPLFQVMFALQNAPLPPLRSPELVLTPLEPASVIAKFDLTLFPMETAEGLSLTMEYNTHLFEAATIDRMLGHFQTLLEGAIANPSEPIDTLPMMSPVEQRMLARWNASPASETAAELDELAETDLDALLGALEGRLDSR
jgi:amino acid adenylation domain-containing protein